MQQEFVPIWDDLSNIAGIYGREREDKRNLLVFGYKVKE